MSVTIHNHGNITINVYESVKPVQSVGTPVCTSPTGPTGPIGYTAPTVASQYIAVQPLTGVQESNNLISDTKVQSSAGVQSTTIPDNLTSNNQIASQLIESLMNIANGIKSVQENKDPAAKTTG